MSSAQLEPISRKFLVSLLEPCLTQKLGSADLSLYFLLYSLLNLTICEQVMAQLKMIYLLMCDLPYNTLLDQPRGTIKQDQLTVALIIQL